MDDPANPRRAGVLAHVSSLPSRGPIGDLGPAAHRFVAWLEEAGCSLWQVLPLNPLGPGNSPYCSASAFATEPAYLSLEGLVADGLLDPREARGPGAGAAVDWDAVWSWKMPLVRRAAARYAKVAERSLEEFAAAHAWAADWALYEALEAEHGGWWSWPEELRARDPEALERERARRRPLILEELALQALFERQWTSLRTAARRHGVELLGDVPIFVSGESCDTWAHRELFLLDADGQPSVRAGVPPDYFAEDGQLWGNPMFAWDAHRADGFRWWRRRLAQTLRFADRVRLDHFRGFVAAWAVPKEAETAREGQWQPGPGRALFDALAADGEGPLPLIAEDLGTIDDDVIGLRQELGLPGMKVLQFAFGSDGSHPFLPHNFSGPRCLVYTGTHDNDTARGWYATASEYERDRFRRYVGRDGSEPGWDMIRLAWSSVAADALAPLQDVLELGAEARMNVPGVAKGNWGWRARGFPASAAHRLRALGNAYGRCDAPGYALRAQSASASESASESGSASPG